MIEIGKVPAEIRWVGLHIVVVVSFCVSLLTSQTVQAQEPICVRSQSTATPWICTSNDLIAAVCPTPPVKKLTAEWHDIETEEAAHALLRKKYSESASAVEFVVWMQCQGFYIYAQPSLRSSKGIMLRARFDRDEITPFKLGIFDIWGWVGGKDSQVFDFALDDSGAIEKLANYEEY